ncbi:MAG: ABC transporter ATP-binding protein [Deltaproteobacteria bacterium]|nr:ABC transporter ATP-binding protein [Deltaproteobacteria bacterium]
MSTALLKVERLTKRFGGLVAVNDISFDISRDEIVGLIGPNGAGKTTLFNLICGSISKSSGSVVLENQDISKMKPYQIAPLGLCKTFQMTSSFPEMTVWENVKVATLRKLTGRDCDDKARDCIELVGLSGSEEMLPGELSHGYLKRLDVARALATSPKLVLLDEPFSGLTISEIRTLSEMLVKLKDYGVTLVIIEHILRELMPLADRIIVLNFGSKLAEGTPREIVGDENVVNAYLGKEWDHAI